MIPYSAESDYWRKTLLEVYKASILEPIADIVTTKNSKWS